MEDKGINVILNKGKWIILGIIILIPILLIIFSLGRTKNENNLENYLTKNGYNHEGNLYGKIDTTENENGVYTTSYSYSVKANKFTKNIQHSNDQLDESILLQYNGTPEIKIYFSGQTHENNEIASIDHSAVYNINNKSFKCKISIVKSKYTSQCDKIKNEAEVFSKEIKNILKEAKINNLFSTKNSNSY